MNKRDGKRLALLTIYALCVASFILVSIQVYFYVKSLEESSRSAKTLMSIDVHGNVERLLVHTRKIEHLVRQTADDLSSGAIDDDEAVSRLKRSTVSDLPIVSSGVFRDESEYRWYKDCPKNAPCWAGPFRSKEGAPLEIAFACPFRDTTGAGGTVFASVPLDAIMDIGDSFKFGDTGYGYMLSSKGTFLYYPIREAVISQKTISEILSMSKNKNSSRIIEATNKALAGKDVKLDIENPDTGQRFRLFYTPIADTPWILGSVFSMDEMSQDQGFMRRQRMWTVLWLVVFLSLITAALVRAYELDPWRLWVLSAAFSLLCMAGSFYIWHLTMTAPMVEEKNKLIFTDMVSLNKFIDDHARSVAALGKKQPSYIPTGIYIQSLEFSGSNDLYITGYVWQKYTDGIHDAVARGLVMPEARTISLREAYRKKTFSFETVGWYFEATIRQRFDYSRYPFDRPNIWIWLRPADFTGNVVLIPDLGSYKFLAPQSMPGLQEGLALPGYSFLGSFFDHEYHLRRVNFGLSSGSQMVRAPELYYNIVVKRNFITPFVSKLFPLFIMFAILFVVQLMFSQDEEKKKAFGFSALAVMGVVITFFFSTLLSHNSLRQDLSADRIIFIENFHFIAYSVLLMVAIKTLLFMGGSRMRLIQYKHGLIPKLLYWPLCTGLVFAISFVSFY